MERVVLVTGGSGGLGTAVTQAFLEDGWRVAVPVHGAGGDVLDALAARHGERLTWFPADLATEDGAGEAIARTANWGGRLDAVVHTVGGYTGGAPLHETAVEDWDRMMSVNLRSAFLVARAAIPRTGDGGSVVFVSSRAAVSGRKGHVPYAVSKAALLTLTEAIAEEYKGRVRANAVLPGTIDTPANRAAMPDANHDAWTKSDQIARVILWLASGASGVVSGAAVPVYGES